MSSSYSPNRNKHTAWCFTLNRPVLTEDEVEDILKSDCRYYIFQTEAGRNETEHLQGYIYLTRRSRLSKVKRLLPRAHWEAAQGTPEENQKYCSKKDTQVCSPREWGDFPGQGAGQGRRTDIIEVYEAIKDGKSHKEIFEDHTTTAFKYRRGINAAKILVKPPRNQSEFQPDVRLYIGPTGCGKTRAVYEEFGEAYEQPLGKDLWFDGYDGEKCALIDDFAGNIHLTTLLKLLDRYVRKVPIKGGHVWWNPTILIITTNNHPTSWYRDTGPNDGRRGNYRALARRFTEVREWKDPRADPLGRESPHYEPIRLHLGRIEINEFFEIHNDN